MVPGLSHQGRMHRQIMEFPNQQFYKGFLNILPENLPAAAKQKAPITFALLPEEDELTRKLYSQRLLFFPCPSYNDALNQKVNRHEAELAGELSLRFNQLFEASGRSLEKDSIGIITPYRAQIAQIRSVLEKKGLPTKLLSVDTVERYQGGAREVIIISLCTNNERQLDSLVSLSDEGIDRKLNVAMTRARSHLVILGNPEILKYNPVYWNLLQHCKVDLF